MRGCILASFPGLIDQTVGGAVSTGTHGSSLAHGSLSQQVRCALPPPAYDWLQSGCRHVGHPRQDQTDGGPSI